MGGMGGRGGTFGRRGIQRQTLGVFFRRITVAGRSIALFDLKRHDLVERQGFDLTGEKSLGRLCVWGGR